MVVDMDPSRGTEIVENFLKLLITLSKCANLLGLQLQSDVAREFSPQG
jgi:hypothetical protein